VIATEKPIEFVVEETYLAGYSEKLDLLTLFLSLSLVLQSQDLRVDQEKESCIGFTQENSIENSVQDCLPYILNYHSLCYFSNLP